MLPIFSSDQEQAIQMEPLNVEVDEWEIEVSRVLLQEVIGRGAFGAVWRALLSSPNGRPGNRTVAAKCFTRKIPFIRCVDTCIDSRGRFKKVYSRINIHPFTHSSSLTDEHETNGRKGKQIN